MKHLLTITITVVLLFAVSSAMSQRLQGGDAAGASPDPAIVGKLREVVTIRQRLVESNHRALQNGRGERDGRYEIALGEARLELAHELGDRNEQIAALRDILKVQQGRLEDAKKSASVGGMAPDDVETNHIAVLEAEVRLLRAPKDVGKP